MALKPGTLLGPHEIISLIGQGGMGEVYKARDTRLNRIVAIKTLPAHLAERPELRERFKREASTLANLKHAHICTLYDIGHQEIAEEDFTGSAGFPATPLPSAALGTGGAGQPAPRVPAAGTLPRRTVGIDYLVMEYLEGETLAERLKKGPLPLEQVLQFAIEISDALDKAHRANFTHRDIKPGNIMLVPLSGSGSKTSSKLLDFGLAKLKQEVAKAITPASEVPTAPGVLTQHGTLLGTLQYMSPEQVEGKTDELDGRTDVFGFGAVVYEMATGKKAFDGKNQSSVIAKILEIDPPPMSSLQPPGKLSPPALDRVVKRCLAKDRDERWQTAYDLWQDLQWIKESGAQAGMPAPLTARRKAHERLGWIGAGIFLVAFLAALVPATLYFRRPAEEPIAGRFLVDFPQTPAPYQLAISPDGKRLAYVAPFNGLNHIWVRPLDSLEAQAVRGTENATYPFWSPDGRSLGFISGGKLKKVEVSGGPALTLADAGIGYGGTWNKDGIIVFYSGRGLSRISAAGGEPVSVTTRDASRGEVNHLWPYLLPDGRHFLYTVQATRPESQGIFVGTLESKEKTRLLPDLSMAAYAPHSGASALKGAPGYLLFVRQGTLMAQPFDAARLQLTGGAVPIAEQVGINTGNARAGFAVSDNGVLAYRTGSGLGNSQLAWFDRSGKQLGTIGPPGAYLNPRLSPDGKRVAVEQVTASNRDIWILEVERGIASRFTFDPAEEYDPLWSPDGKQIAYVSKASLYQKPSSGAGTEEILLKEGVGTSAHDWSSDGRFITYRPTQGPDIWVLPLAGDPSSREAGSGQGRKPFPFLQTEFLEVQSQISLDGKWLAYLSDESGRFEVYVQSFPKPAGKWQVSTNGGVQPRWRRDGKELFYIAPDQKLMAASIRSDGTLEVGAPQALFETRTVLGATTGPYFQQQYDVAPDGQRFLMNVTREGAAAALITVVLNWTAGIKK